MKVKVISTFRDKFTSKMHNIGEVILISDESRVEDLVKRNLVEVLGEKKETSGLSIFDQTFDKQSVVGALKSIGVQATMNMKDETVLGKVNELDEEETSELKKHLGIE